MTLAVEGTGAAGVDRPTPGPATGGPGSAGRGGPVAGLGRRFGGVLTVWRWECMKLRRQRKVHVSLLCCLAGPFAFVAGLEVQGAVPADTLFGQWVHRSGFAVPLVILGFAGQWVLPALVAVVAGDIFSSEDGHRTWQTVLTRSRGRGEVYLGKVVAAASYAVVALGVLAVASLAAGAILGTRPLVGLSGQLVAPGHAALLVLASWATQLAPVLGYCGLAVLLSVATRSSAVGIAGPLVIGLLMQLSTLVALPEAVRAELLSTPFASWHGFWVVPAYAGPLREGLITSAAWVLATLDLAWIVFRSRDLAMG